MESSSRVSGIGPLSVLHLGATAVLFPVAIWAVFRYVPTAVAANGEPNPVQRIFYFHVPSAFMTFFCVGVLFVCSVLYLATRRRAFDRAGLAATEVGMMFCTIVLVTGPIWAKPEWGRAWTWEPRLNLTAVLWLIFLGAVLVRSYSDHRDQAARFASALGIVTLPVVYLVYVSVEKWGGVHPRPTIGREPSAHDPRITTGFVICLVAFLVLTLWLIRFRARLARTEERVEDLRAAIDEGVPAPDGTAGPTRSEGARTAREATA